MATDRTGTGRVGRNHSATLVKLLLVGSTIGATLLSPTTPASAASAVVTGLNGRALAGVTITEAGPSVSVQEFTPEVNLNAPPGGVGPFDDGGSISGKFEGLSGSETVRTEGTNLGTEFGSVVSNAVISNLFIAGFRVSGQDDVIGEIGGSCAANRLGASGLVTTPGLSIFGVALPQGPVEPNTTFFRVVQTGTGFNLVTVVLNEQTLVTDIAGATTIEMNTLRIRLEQNIGPRRTLILGQLRCRATGPSPSRPLLGDFDGDGHTDTAVWRPDNGTWYVRGISETVWGQTGDVPVPADYAGDARSEIAVWRPDNGTWYIRGVAETVWGQPGDIPVPADYNGDGKADIAVYRPSNNTWYVRGISETVWGQFGDVPVPADYAGDAKTEIAVWRPGNGTWYVRGVSETVWGQLGDVPLPANYGGDAKADLAVWRPDNGTWYVRGISETVWGASGDTPVPGDYNGGGADLVVWRPSNATWYVRGVSETLWGVPTDIPA